MSKRASIIDLGTNTFHMIIVEWEGNMYRVLDRCQIAVKLGKGSFETGMLQTDRWNAGIAAIIEFKSLIDRYEIQKLYAYGTSAIRNAKNGIDFITESEQILGHYIEVIDGQREAELIYLGVRKSLDMHGENFLIMDIGGGSVEFIIASDKKIFWSQSFEMGIARLLEIFNPEKPMTSNNAEAIRNYLENTLSDLWIYTKLYEVKGLIGASGTFESLAHTEVLEYQLENRLNFTNFISHRFNIEVLNDALNRLIYASAQRVKQFRGVPDYRREMISIACLMIQFVVEHLDSPEVYASDFSLKEGALFSLMDETITDWKLMR